MADETEPGVEVDIGVALVAAIGDLSTELAAARQWRMEQSERDITDQATGWGGAEVPASGVLAQPITAQAVIGRGMEVRSISVGGGAVTDAPAGVLYVVRSAMPGVAIGENTPAMLTLVDYTRAALPQVAFYSSGQLVLRRTEQLWGVLIGGTLGQDISGSVSFKELPGESYRGSESL